MTTPTKPDADGWITHESETRPADLFVEVKDDFGEQYVDASREIFWGMRAGMPRVLIYRPLVPAYQLEAALARVADLERQIDDLKLDMKETMTRFE